MGTYVFRLNLREGNQVKLVGVTEIAAMLGVSRQRAAQLVASKGFPKPLDRLAMGPVWKRSTVESWRAKNGR